jgi:hypothetical protein
LGGNLKRFSFNRLKKKMLWMCLFLLLVPGMAFMTVSVHAVGLPKIILDPVEYEVQKPGDTFTIDVNITNTPLLQSYEFKLCFNNTLLNATDVTPGPINPTGTTYAPGQNISGVYTWTPLQNVSQGFVWVNATFPSGSWFYGNGTMMTVNFTAIEEGHCTLLLNDTKLINPIGNPIYHLTGGSSITVIPEFPVTIVAPLLLTATLAAACLGKVFWSTRRRGRIIAKRNETPSANI